MTKTTLDQIAETAGFGNALLCLSVEIGKFEKHPDCTAYQRGLLRAAREAVWLAELEILAPRPAVSEPVETSEAAQ